MEQKNEKKCLDLKIIAFEFRTIHSHNREQDTCHWQSMCYETPIRFKISITEIISELRSWRVMKKYDENALMQILQEFGTL